MTDDQQFDIILRELGQLMVALGDLAFHIVLIGGQVPSLEMRQRHGTAVIQAETATGIRVVRPFSREPDLLFNAEQAGPHADRLPLVLQDRGFKRTKSYRWAKDVDGISVELDLFMPAGADDYMPTAMTPLPDAERVLSQRKQFPFEANGRRYFINIPKPAAFLAMKVQAKKELRPRETKDCFDLWAYTAILGEEEIVAALEMAPELRDDLRELFGTTSAVGVQDVVAFAGPLDAHEQALLAQGVVDLFTSVLNREAGS